MAVASIGVGKDHTTIQDWLDATVSSGVTEVGELYDQEVINTDLDISAITWPALGAYRELRNADGLRYNPYTDTGAKIIVDPITSPGAIYGARIQEDYFRLRGIGIEFAYPPGAVPTSEPTQIYKGVSTEGRWARIDSVFVRIAIGTATSVCFENTAGVAGTNDNNWFLNCIAQGSARTTHGAGFGFNSDNSGAKLFNCVASETNRGSGTYGFIVTYNAVTANYSAFSGATPYGVTKEETLKDTRISNCVSVRSDVDFLLTGFNSNFKGTHNISGDLTAPGANPAVAGIPVTSWTNVDQEQVFVRPDIYDYRNLAGSPGVATGVDLSGYENEGTLGFTTAFEYNPAGSRQGSWEIGPYDGYLASARSIYNPTIKIRKIGASAPGGYDDLNVQAFLDATDVSLCHNTDGNFDHTRYIGEVYDSESIGAGWLVRSQAHHTDTQRYRMLRPAAGHYYDPISDTGVKFTATASTYVFAIEERYFRLSGFGIYSTTFPTAADGVRVRARGVQVSRCFSLMSPVTGVRRSFTTENNYPDIFLANNIAQGTGVATGATRGYYLDSDRPRVHNCNAHQISGSGSAGEGFEKVSSTPIVLNCIATDCDTDFNVASGQGHNISSDATALGFKSLTSQTAASIYVDADNNNFSLIRTGPAHGTGKNLSAYPLVAAFGPIGIRTPPWDVGAYNSFAAAPLTKKPGYYPSNSQVVCWLIERKDGTLHTFTNHNHVLLHNGFTFTPVGAFDSSAHSRESGLAAGNRQFTGMVADEITEADLLARRFDDAKVTEFLIDSMYPFATPYLTNTFFIESIGYNGIFWQAEISSLAGRLQQPVGLRYQKLCNADLFDDKCRKNPNDGDVYIGDGIPISVINENQRIFTATTLGTAAVDHYGLGKISWITGNNAGVVSNILNYSSGYTIELAIPTPLLMQVGDLFYIEPGCKKRLARDCDTKWSNVQHNQGYEFIPGLDRTLQTPSA